jgi:hypothetical protein
MHALTIKNPWAYLIAKGIKDIENRTWSTGYRGPLLIHVSKTPDIRNCTRAVVNSGIMPYGEFIRHLAKTENLAGNIIGIVDLVDIVKDHESEWAAPGEYHWVLKNPVLFKKPSPHRGKLNIWHADTFLLKLANPDYFWPKMGKDH